MRVGTKKFLLFLGDLFFIFFASLLAVKVRYWKTFQWPFFWKLFFPFSLAYLFWLFNFYLFGLYEFSPINIVFFLKLISLSIFNFFIAVALFYFFPFLGVSPKTLLFLNLVFLAFFLFLWRILFYFFFSAYFLKRTVILGKEKEAEELKEAITKNSYLGYKLVEVDWGNNFLEKIKAEKIEIIIFGKEYEKEKDFLKNIFPALSLGVSFWDLASAYEEIKEKIPVFKISIDWFLENLKENEKKVYDKAKRFFDILFALLVLIFTLPFWPLIALLIKLEDGGPVFYLQERVGKNGKVFRLIKFRSMVPEADKIGPKWAEEKDQRVTKIGKFLRKTHFDELPQMINILKGEMSAVGPRPQRVEFVREFEEKIPYYNFRHIIKPGFTGWGQVKFDTPDSSEDFASQFQYDLYYIKNRSFLLDLRILIKTLSLFFRK